MNKLKKQSLVSFLVMLIFMFSLTILLMLLSNSLYVLVTPKFIFIGIPTYIMASFLLTPFVKNEVLGLKD